MIILMKKRSGLLLFKLFLNFFEKKTFIFYDISDSLDRNNIFVLINYKFITLYKILVYIKINENIYYNF
jgi:hypothetical protein